MSILKSIVWICMPITSTSGLAAIIAWGLGSAQWTDWGLVSLWSLLTLVSAAFLSYLCDQ